MSSVNPTVVSVVLVNFRGVDDTLDAIRNLQSINWPKERLEIVVVENASGDDSAQRLRDEATGINLIVSDENLGFAGGCNLGVEKSSGDYIALLNNDARPDDEWIAAAVRRFESSSKIGAVASRVLDWEGEKVDFIGAGLTWFGMGYKPLTAQPVPTTPDVPTDVLFGTGSAMFVRRDVYLELGGFDERFFMFFEDVDLGWRLNLAGWRYAYEPESLAFHKHHASMSKFGAFKETYFLEKNALFSMYKNLGEETLNENLAAALALAVRRAIARGELDSTSLDLRRGGDESETQSVSKDTLATIYGIDQFVQELPGLKKSRDHIQSTRKVDEAKIWSLFGETDAPSFAGDYFHEGYNNLVQNFSVLGGPTARNVLIITGDPIGPKMAGPAIRAWNMAEALSANNQVTLASFSGVKEVKAPFDVVHVPVGAEKEMKALESKADIIVFQGLAMALYKCIRETKKILVCDIYDPMHLEHLEQGKEHAVAEWTQQVSSATDVLNEQLERGDYFLCASERQRHFYLGQLAALGRINPANYDNNPDLTGLISVVPFGLDSKPPVHEKSVLKGAWPGIEADDKVLLWSGGVYNWFDPKNLIRAVAELSKTRPNVRLFFQGTKHPNPGVPEMAIVAESRALAAELGVLDSSVFFNSSWVDYADRQNFLTEADAGVSTHYSHIETTFSFRTRILDYLWADLPMVVTEGDHFADLVAQKELGVVVPAEDVSALAAALERVLFDDDFSSQVRENIREAKKAYEWDTVLEPLVNFVNTAHFAEDRVRNGSAALAVSSEVGRTSRNREVKVRKHGLAKDIELAQYYWKNGGPKLLTKKVVDRAKLMMKR